ncbi:hypothetical protein [Shewanella japonica]|uniref:hypothetical protein n=1 Tax=Shewanella japonica TaxID=93973 RepID=UPI002494D2F7|nr:hypothetical protein [Shewanella japonica]
MTIKLQRTLCLITLLLSFNSIAEQRNIVVSATALDIETEEINYDIATITISGPNNFSYQAQLDSKDTQLDFQRLGGLIEGHYKYEIQYSKNSGIEKVTDRKTGRDNVYRNIGEVTTDWGHFNVLNGEFVDGQLEQEAPANIKQ